MSMESTMSLERIKTANGHSVAEAASALQKAIRRSELDDAIYWAVDLYLIGYGEYVWRRLKIIASEDVGLADRYLPATLAALHDTYRDQVKAGKKRNGQAGERLSLVHAVTLLVTAPKSRLVDNATICHLREHAERRREVPDYALDMHTRRGREKGRDAAHFLRTVAALVQPDAAAILAAADKRYAADVPRALTRPAPGRHDHDDRQSNLF
jgi:replication-associated recombination protein RarA